MSCGLLTVSGLSHAWSGKLPSRGDFLEGGAHRSLLAWMTDWASEGMVAIRAGGGPAADGFLTSPIQRFVGSSGSLAKDAMIGVLGPGMDRGGRLYPFAIAVGLGPATEPAATWTANAPWFDRAETIYFDCLRPDFDPATLDAILPELEDPPPETVPGDAPGGAVFAPLGGDVSRSDGPPSFESLFASAMAETASGNVAH